MLGRSGLFVAVALGAAVPHLATSLPDVGARYAESFSHPGGGLAGCDQRGWGEPRRGSAVGPGTLDAASEQVRAQVRGAPGEVALGIWPRSGTVVVEWKAPVPDQVRRLEGVRPDGVEVRVVDRPYSQRELLAAVGRVTDFLDERGVDWSVAGPCTSGAGIQVVMVQGPASSPFSGDDLAAVVGVPVVVTSGTARFA